MSGPLMSSARRRLDQWVKRHLISKGHDVRKWRGKKGERLETSLETEIRGPISADVLHRGGSEHTLLARSYEKCWNEQPCGHQMEPHCARRLRINFVGCASKAFATHCGNKPLWAVTLVLEEGKFAPGALDEASMADFVKLVRRKLAKAGLGLLSIIGAVDISYNENSEGTWKSHWQLHIHCVVAGSTKKELNKRLKKVFPKTRTIRKPVEVKPVYDLMGKLSYCCKSYFERRVSYIDSKGHWNSRFVSLKPLQFREVSLFMATQSVSSRFLFQGFRRRGRYLERTS